MDDPTALFGRLHPLVLHLPIGMVVALALLEVAALFARLELGRRAMGLLVAITALSALLAAGTGWVLGDSGDYGGELLERHRNLGLAVAGGSLLAALLHAASRQGARHGALRLYRALLFVTAALMVPAGHLGATLTHGADFLLGDQPPVELAPKPIEGDGGADGERAAPVAQRSTFEAEILPLLEARCTSCHGESKRKGKLALHDAASIQAGSGFGPVVVPGEVEQSELALRLRLPPDDEGHMPPEGKPQLTEAQILRLEAWIAAGAPYEGVVDLGLPAPEPIVPAAAEPEQPSRGAIGSGPAPDDPGVRHATATSPRPDPAALAALTGARVHVEPLDPLAGELWVDFSAVASETDDAAAVALLEPLAGSVAHLGLARTRIGEPTLEQVARMHALTRLDLRATPVDDQALSPLSGHAALEELVLAQTRLTDASVETLLLLPALRRVVLWDSGISPEGRARLATERPELSIEAGDTPDSAALEVEPEPAFTSDRPLPGAESSEPDLLAPVNSVCPVSGSPVNPRYRVVYDGRVIGFCCPECPKAFWADPEACLAKLR